MAEFRLHLQPGESPWQQIGNHSRSPTWHRGLTMAVERREQRAGVATRALGDGFRRALAEGVLSPVTKAVKGDTSLCLELRGSSVNVYYRGGSLLKISRTNSGKRYRVRFDPKYFKGGRVVTYPRNIDGSDGVGEVLEAVPMLKQAMDRFFGRNRREEREFQQRMLYENNLSTVARATDYYVCDIEYEAGGAKFDMIAAHWPSKPHVRQRAHGRRLAFVEVKHGDGAVEGRSGLAAHVHDVNAFAADRRRLAEFKADMVDVFNQKRALGLVDCGKDLAGFSDQKPLLVLALANHDPDKSGLKDELERLPPSPNVELRFATGAFLGGGLFDQGIWTLDEVRARFPEYIYSGGRS